MAAHINNTASQGAGFTGDGWKWGVGTSRGKDGGTTRGNEAFAALIESPSLAASRSCQERVCLQHGLCGSHLPTVCLM